MIRMDEDEYDPRAFLGTLTWFVAPNSCLNIFMGSPGGFAEDGDGEQARGSDCVEDKDRKGIDAHAY